jgi:hypothetical protein
MEHILRMFPLASLLPNEIGRTYDIEGVQVYTGVPATENRASL